MFSNTITTFHCLVAVKRTLMAIIASVILTFLVSPVSAQKGLKPIPVLQKRGNSTQLMVDGKPFLILGGELHNSSASNLNYLKPILPKLALMHMNTVLAPVTWDQLEPVEGKFDFSLIDGLVKQARANKLRVIVLWFGAWKNGLSTYAPEWVITNTNRFPRVKLSNSKSIETISPFNGEILKADTRAFAQLMKHIKTIDAAERTVIMVQVENEVGVHGDSRDRSDLANTAFNQQVPSILMGSLQKNKDQLQPDLKKAWEKDDYKSTGTWEDVFGKSKLTDEIFMAWYYARYVNTVATAGKAMYHLPMYVNAWLPPNHPSGGPVAEVHDVWRAGAPDIDIFSPDVYKPNFRDIVGNYYHSWNPLFIPESVADSAGASNAYLAIGRYNAIGFSPFAVDERIPDPVNSAVPQAYRALAEAAPVILDAQSKGTITAVSLDKNNPSETMVMGNYKLEAHPKSAKYKTPGATSGYGLIIHSSADEFIISGVNLEVVFSSAMADGKTVGFVSVYEGMYKNGQWLPARKLNGDEIMVNYSILKLSSQNLTNTVIHTQQNNTPGTIKVKLYTFK